MLGLQTRKELAERLGVPQGQVADWELDRYRVLEVRSLVRLAKAFHCSVDELLAGVDPDYDRVLEHIAAGASAAGIWPDIAVVGEGDARAEVLGWLPRPAGLGDPRAYGVQIRGDAMMPAFRPTNGRAGVACAGGAGRRRGVRAPGARRASGPVGARLHAPGVQSRPPAAFREVTGRSRP